MQFGLRGLLFCVLAWLAVFVPGVANSDADTRQVLIVADPDWPPYFFAGRGEDPPGFAKEVLGHCTAALGFRANFRSYPILRMRVLFENGDIDLMVSDWRRERLHSGHYTTHALFTDSFHPVMRRGEGRPIEWPHDLDGLKLRMMIGVDVSKEFRDYINTRPDVRQVPLYASQHEMLRGLLAKQFDVFVGSLNAIAYDSRILGIANQLDILDTSFNLTDYFVLVSRISRRVQQPAVLAAAFDACVEQMRGSGALGELRTRYLRG